MNKRKPNHWICKDCKTANHKNRLTCLSCDKPKSIVLLYEGSDYNNESKFNNGEYP